MKRIKIQLTAAFLIAVVFLSAVLVPAKPAYAIAGVDDAAFILAMLAAAGAGYVGYSSYNSGNSNLAEDLWGELEDLEDDISDAFDKSVFKVLEGGGGSSDPDDFDPDNDDPEEKPTTWEKLKEWWKKHPEVALSIGVNGSVIAAIMNQFSKNLDAKSSYEQYDLAKLNMPDFLMQEFQSNLKVYPYFYITKYSNNVVANIWMSSKPAIFFQIGKNYYFQFNSAGVSFHNGDNKYTYVYPNSWTNFLNFSSSSYTSVSGFISNSIIHVYSSYEEGLAASNDYSYSSNLNPDSVLKTDAKKKADEDEEEKPAYDNVVLPTPDQMADYANKLDAIAQSDAEPAVKKEQQQQVMNTFVESITNVSSNPNPSPDPDPTPDPSPDPDPSPEPDPDSPTTDEEAASYTADLTTVFPFCVPFDLIRAFKVLSVQGEAPVYDIPLKIDYKYVHVNESWSIDMSDFSSVIQILRVMETLAFIVGLILVTRKLIRG